MNQHLKQLLMVLVVTTGVVGLSGCKKDQNKPEVEEKKEAAQEEKKDEAANTQETNQGTDTTASNENTGNDIAWSEFEAIQPSKDGSAEVALGITETMPTPDGQEVGGLVDAAVI